MAEITVDNDMLMYEEEVTTDVAIQNNISPVEYPQNVIEHEVMNIELDLTKCVICQKPTNEQVSAVGRGMQNLLQQLELTGRNNVGNYIELHKSNHVVLLHLSCRRQLSYEADKTKRLNTDTVMPKQRRTRSAAIGFCFKDNCFLCGEAVTGSKDVRKVLSGKEFDENIRTVIRERGPDEWATVVQGRMGCISDLFAADAVYHKNCYTRFVRKLTLYRLLRACVKN